MRVLDIDLDFFLNDTCPLAEPGQRPVLEGNEPWDEAEVQRFLKKNLHLSTAHPLPGRIFRTHDGALCLWDELLRAGKLTAPFDVTHIDAHSDLGIGKPGPGIVLSGVLCQKMGVRCDLERYYRLKQLDEANYLLFALAFRWVGRLENVRNPKSKHDLPEQIVFEYDPDGTANMLRLTPPLPDLFEKLNGREPVIPYREYASAADFDAGSQPFDFMSVAVSPRYAPREADALLPVFAQYMEHIPG